MSAGCRLRLGACVIACNEERDLPRCLESLAFADERVVVVDARSRDATLEIARRSGARVFQREYAGNIEQKRFALAQAESDWILSLDADEAVTPQLAREIRGVLAEPEPRVVGYELNRVTWHLGRWIRHGDFHPDWQLRLVRRGAGDWSGTNPHGRLRVTGPVRRLRGELEHHSYRDLADQVDRIQDFSTAHSRSARPRAAAGAVRDLLLRPPARFLRAFVLKQGFRDGVPGLVIAGATAFHVFLKYAKEWERIALGELPAGEGPRGKTARSQPRGGLGHAP